MSTISLRALRRRRATLDRRLMHLQERLTRQAPHPNGFDLAEASALQTAILLFDEAIEARMVALAAESVDGAQTDH